MECVEDRAVRLTIEAQPSNTGPATSTPFEPHPSDTRRRRRAAEAVPAASGPERRLTLLALRLAVLEKAASGLGALGFIWATVVLLGGFAITLGRVDFWSVTAILLVEGARLFSRSHELEWQHQATWSLARSGARLVARSFRRLVFPHRRSHVTTSSKQPATSWWPWWWTRGGWSWSHLSCHVGRAFYWLQLASATSCVALSAARLARQDFGDAAEARTNRRAALGIFYALALAEALLFLLEKAAWEWEVTHGRVLERVARECRLLPAGGGSTGPGILAVRRFFYDAYARCVAGSVLDGLRMDLVSFACELLVAGSRDEQRIGVGILVAGAEDDEALRRVGAARDVVERLLEMMSWKDHDGEARASAALVVSKLAGKKRDALRLAGVPGAVEAVASLLHAEDDECNLLGLLIVKKLAGDHGNCARIGGLLDKIIEFSSPCSSSSSPAAGGPTVLLTPSRAKAVRRALQVISLLAGATGGTGRRLRREIAEIVFTVSNVRAVLRHVRDAELRRLGAEVLTRLAVDDVARERIGATGGVLALLLDMFLLSPGAGAANEQADAARVEAGEALAMLSLESPRNCERILKAGGGAHTGAATTVDRLVDALDDPVVGVGAARVLTHLCAYTSDELVPHLRAATRGAAAALRHVATADDECKQLETALGLAAQLVRLMDDGPGELAHHMVNAGVSESDLVNRLVGVLASHAWPSIKAPRIRRFAVELVVALLRMMRGRAFAEVMREAGMGAELRRVAETTSELECFHEFSGSAGVGRHAVGLADLVDTALELMSADDVVDEAHA